MACARMSSRQRVKAIASATPFAACLPTAAAAADLSTARTMRRMAQELTLRSDRCSVLCWLCLLASRCHAARYRVLQTRLLTPPSSLYLSRRCESMHSATTMRSIECSTPSDRCTASAVCGTGPSVGAVLRARVGHLPPERRRAQHKNLPAAAGARAVTARSGDQTLGYPLLGR